MIFVSTKICHIFTLDWLDEKGRKLIRPPFQRFVAKCSYEKNDSSLVTMYATRSIVNPFIESEHLGLLFMQHRTCVDVTRCKEKLMVATETKL